MQRVIQVVSKLNPTSSSNLSVWDQSERGPASPNLATKLTLQLLMEQRQKCGTTAEPAMHSTVVVAVLFAVTFIAGKGEEVKSQNRVWTLEFGWSLDSKFKICMVTTDHKGPVRQLYCPLVVRKHRPTAFLL